MNVLRTKETNYKTKAFILLIILILLSIIEYFFILYWSITGIIDTDTFIQIINIEVIFFRVITLVGILLTILSIVNKERKNYLYYISIVGYLFFTIWTIYIYI